MNLREFKEALTRLVTVYKQEIKYTSDFVEVGDDYEVDCHYLDFDFKIRYKSSKGEFKAVWPDIYTIPTKHRGINIGFDNVENNTRETFIGFNKGVSLVHFKEFSDDLKMYKAFFNGLNPFIDKVVEAVKDAKSNGINGVRNPKVRIVDTFSHIVDKRQFIIYLEFAKGTAKFNTNTDYWLRPNESEVTISGKDTTKFTHSKNFDSIIGDGKELVGEMIKVIFMSKRAYTYPNAYAVHNDVTKILKSNGSAARMISNDFTKEIDGKFNITLNVGRGLDGAYISLPVLLSNGILTSLGVRGHIGRGRIFDKETNEVMTKTKFLKFVDEYIKWIIKEL